MKPDRRARRAHMILLAALTLASSVGAWAAEQSANGPGMPMPAKVQAVMDKIAANQPLSAEDQKVLSDYSSALSKQSNPNSDPGAGGGAPSAGANGKTPIGEFSVGSGEAQSPCVHAGHAIGFGTTPSRADYVAMVHDALQTYGPQLAPEAHDKLMAALGQGAPTAGSDLAPLLVVTGDTDAAIFSAVYAAEHAPDDVLAANNLGVMLRARQDYARAAIALQYASSLAPKNTLVATNLGWLALGQGDSKAAGSYFKMTVAEDPHAAVALAGQGVIQMCSGHPVEALPLFRASMAARYSALAAEGISIAVDSASQEAHGAKPDMGSPDVYGAKSKSALHDWPEPPIPSDAETMAAYGFGDIRIHTALRNYIELFDKQEMGATLAANAGDAAEQQGAKTEFDGQSIIFHRGYDNEIFVLGDLRTILQGELQKPMDDLRQQAEKFIDNPCLSCASGGYSKPPEPSCSYQRAVIGDYPPYAPLFKNDWAELQKAIDDLYAFSDPWLARIHDPAIAAAERGKLDSFAMLYISNFANELLHVAVEVRARWTFHTEDSCQGDAQAKASKPPQLKHFGVDPNDCQVQGTVLPMPFATMSADCDQISLQIAIGPFAGSAKYQFAPMYTEQNGKYAYTGGDDGNWTIFAGGRIGTPGPIGVAASAGPYVSFQGGHVTDIGVQAGANLAGSPGESVPLVGTGAGGNVRLGAMSGLSAAPSPGVAGGWGGQ